MGYSWALSAKVVVPKGEVAAYRDLVVRELRGAPAGWGSANQRGEMRVVDVLSELTAEEMVEVAWLEDGVRAAGVVSNDSSTWADLRTHVVAAVRAAASVGGAGEISIAGWMDGAPELAFVAAAADGVARFDALDGAAGKALEERVHAEVGPIVERRLEALRQATPVKLDFAEPVVALHAEVLSLLRRLPPERVFEEASKRREPWPSPRGLSTFVPLVESFPSTAALLDAVGGGFRNLHLPAAVLGFALELLTELDLPAAKGIARRALELSPLPPPPMRMAAEAVGVRCETEADLEAALELLRDKLRPAEPLFFEHPIVRRIRAAAPERVLPVVRRVLGDLVGGPTTGTPYATLEDQDAAFAKVLTFVLRDLGTDEDLALVLPLWIGYSHPRLAAFELAWNKGGAAAKPLFADMFGCERPDIDYGHVRQRYALLSLAELDPDRLFSEIEELGGKAKLTREQTHAMEAVFEQASVAGSPWSPGWARALRTVAARHAGQVWGQRASLTLAVHREPDGIEWALDTLREAGAGRDQQGLDWLAGVLEASADASFGPRLREILPGLDRRGKTRVEKCIAKLEGTAPQTPMDHHVGVSPSARATCRTCKQRIGKGELRFGEAVPNAFSDSGEPTFRFFHLLCAAEKKPALLGPALAAYGGEVPERDALVATIEAKLSKKKRKKKEEPGAPA